MLGLFVRAFSCDRVVFSSCLGVLLIFLIIHGFVVNKYVLLCGFKQTKGKRHENSDSFDRTAAGIGCGVCVGDLWPVVAGGGGMTKDEALDLALEALESCEWGLGDQYFDALLVHKAITAIKQARSAPVQEPDHGDELTIAYMSGVHRGKELARADEREACAKVAEWEPCMTDTSKRIAAAIRARSKD
jgi:hypothetical protein